MTFFLSEVNVYPMATLQSPCGKTITAAALVSNDFFFLRSLSTQIKIYHNCGNHTETQADLCTAIQWKTKHCANAEPELFSQCSWMD